jgi:hypothetical protein
VGIDLVRLGLTAVNGLHVQGVPQDEGDVLGGAQVGEPVPGEHALTGDDQTRTKRLGGVEKSLGRRVEGLLQDDVPGGIEDTQRKRSGVQIDARVKCVLLGVESHHGLRGKGNWLLVTPVYLTQRGHDEYPCAAADRGGT